MVQLDGRPGCMLTDHPQGYEFARGCTVLFEAGFARFPGPSLTLLFERLYLRPGQQVASFPHCVTASQGFRRHTGIENRMGPRGASSSASSTALLVFLQIWSRHYYGGFPPSPCPTSCSSWESTSSPTRSVPLQAAFHYDPSAGADPALPDDAARR